MAKALGFTLPEAALNPAFDKLDLAIEAPPRTRREPTERPSLSAWRMRSGATSGSSLHPRSRAPSRPTTAQACARSTSSMPRPPQRPPSTAGYRPRRKETSTRYSGRAPSRREPSSCSSTPCISTPPGGHRSTRRPPRPEPSPAPTGPPSRLRSCRPSRSLGATRRETVTKPSSCRTRAARPPWSSCYRTPALMRRSSRAGSRALRRRHRRAPSDQPHHQAAQLQDPRRHHQLEAGAREARDGRCVQQER